MSVRGDFHPGNIVTDTLGFPAGDGRLDHGQVCFAAGRWEGGGNVILATFRIGQPQDDHVLGHPAFASGNRRTEAQRQAFFAQQRIAAVAGAVRPDSVLIREMADIFFFHWCAGPGNVFLPFRQRRAQGMQAFYKFFTFIQQVDHLASDPRHDVHIADDIRTIGNFDRHL